MTSWANLPGAQKWLITLSVMLVTIMQILDTSVTNVVLPLAIPLMRRVRTLPAKSPDESAGRVEPLPSSVE